MAEIGNSSLSSEIISVYRAVDDFERRIGGRQHIDLSLAPLGVSLETKSPIVNSRSEALTQFQECRLLLPTDLSPNTELIRSILDSTITYYQALNGENIDFANFIESTLGIKLKPITLEQVAQQRGVVEELARELGFKFNRVGHQRFLQSEKLTPQEAEQEFRDAIEEGKPHLKKLLKIGDDKFEYQIEHQSVDDYWLNYSSVRRDSEGRLINQITFNRHPRMQRHYARGNPTRLGHHEGAHIVQQSLWEEGIREGTIDPFIGEVTLPGPLAVPNEGLANTVDKWVPGIGSTIDTQTRFFMERGYHSELVWGYIQEKLEANEIDVEAAKYGLRRLNPALTDEDIEMGVNWRLKSPWHRGYLYAYPVASINFRRWAAGLSDLLREQLAVQLFKVPMNTTQIRTTIGDLLYLNGRSIAEGRAA